MKSSMRMELLSYALTHSISLDDAIVAVADELADALLAAARDV